MRESIFETLVGLAVVAVAVGFLMFSVQTGADTAPGDTYDLSARFNRIDGIASGSDVRLSGVKVGVVTAIDLDPETYLAEVSMTMANNLQVPDDSTAQVTTDGLLGGSYIAIEPGGSFDYIEPGGEIEFTRGSVDLLTLLASAASGSAE
ncbi:MAG: outer membrane lipid asymmetry maintenance protein MlaD [Pseudomonadota bacterium]